VGILEVLRNAEPPELTFSTMFVSSKYSEVDTIGWVRHLELSYPPRKRLPLILNEGDPICKLYDSEGVKPSVYASGRVLLAVH
jgi:hypothetical protein